VDQRNDDTLLLVLLALLVRDSDDLDEPYAYELFRRLNRSGRFREQLGPEFEHLFEGAFRTGRRRERRLAEVREIAAAVAKTLREGFSEQADVFRTALLAFENSRHAHAQEEIVRDELQQIRESLAETAVDLYDAVWLVSSGGSLAKAEIRQSVPVRVYFSDSVPANRRDEVVFGIQELLMAEGFELAFELPDEDGSWWKRFVFRSKTALTHDEVTKRLKKAERAVEVTYLDKPQAEANNLQAVAAASLIGALNDTERACIQVGSLLVVKATDGDGKTAVIARTLSQDELREIEENQSILREPQKILEFLENAGPKRIQ
jgi:hypothetical protein